MAVSVVSYSFSWAAQPEPWSPLCWVLAFLTTSHQQLLWSQNSIGVPKGPLGRVCLSLPHSSISVSNSTRLYCLLFNSSALYYLQNPTWCYGHASTPLQFLPISGDRDVSLQLSLEWPVWSSSSGNNCHAVHMSLSSGASVYECTMGNFYLVPFHQPISAHAISSHNWHWNVSLPSGASPWMAFWAGSKGQHITSGDVSLLIKNMYSLFCI